MAFHHTDRKTKISYYDLLHGLPLVTVLVPGAFTDLLYIQLQLHDILALSQVGWDCVCLRPLPLLLYLLGIFFYLIFAWLASVSSLSLCPNVNSSVKSLLSIIFEIANPHTAFLFLQHLSPTVIFIYIKYYDPRILLWRWTFESRAHVKAYSVILIH